MAVGIVALVLILGCGQKRAPAAAYSRTTGMGRSYAEMPAPMPAAMQEEMAMEAETHDEYASLDRARDGNFGSPGTANDDAGSHAERKLVKRAYIRIRVENLAAADAAISDLMTQYGAYAASMEIEENSRYYSLRVPAPEYDAFLRAMDGMGRMLRRSENTEDVTLRYYDLEGRLATKKELLKTFQAYLGKANNIQDILSVEARIAELQYDIEGTGVQFRNLANQVDYTTIDLNLLGPVAASSNRGATFGERIKELLNSFGYFLSTVAVILTGIVIYGIPILLLLAFLFWVFFGRIGLIKKLWRIVKGKRE